MKKIIYLVLTIIILVSIVIFTLQNTNEIQIHLFYWKIQVSLALLIFSLFSFGIIIAIFVLMPAIIALKSTIKKDEELISKLRKSVAPNKEEVTE